MEELIKILIKHVENEIRLKHALLSDLEEWRTKGRPQQQANDGDGDDGSNPPGGPGTPP